MSKIVNSSNRKISEIKHNLTQKKADEIIGKIVSYAVGKTPDLRSSFSQVVLRRSYCSLPEKVPFFAYTFERNGLVYVLQAGKGTPNTVFVVPCRNIRSISDGRTKVAKMRGRKWMVAQ